MAAKLRVLILGDELGLAEAIVAAMKADGHEVEAVLRHDEALNFMPQKKIDFVFVDCMLPGSTNGVEFVQQARRQFPQAKTKYVLMSGIFTDKDFVKDAMNRTKAVAFVAKKSPFDTSQLTRLVKGDEAQSEVVSARKILYGMFSQDKVSNRQKRKIIESLEEVSGLDLPFIYSLLVETGSSGYLNIYEKSGAVSGVSISEGNIVTVDVEDKTTFLGEMLIQSGYALPQHVQTALAERTNQKIGTRLIRANQLSPHAFDLILTEQMNIRLSRTVADQNIRINFAATEVEKTTPCIDSDLLLFYLHDWIASKLTLAWLKPLYLSWASNAIRLAPHMGPEHGAARMGLVKALPGLIERLQTGVTLNQLMEEQQYTEIAIYKGLHFLLTRGLITFGEKEAFRTDAEQQAALRKLWHEVQNKSPFELVEFLGVENMFGDGLHALIGHEPKESGSVTMTLWKNLTVKIGEAHRLAGDSEARAKFQQDAAGRDAEVRLLANRKTEEARTKLGLNQFSPALALLMDVQKTHPQMEGMSLLLAWAKIGCIDPAKKPAQLREIEFDLVQVSAEEKYDANYPFVLGLFHRAKGDVMGAKKHFEKAIALNPSMIAARRELSSIDAQLKKEKDIFASVDLKGMVAGLFKKR